MEEDEFDRWARELEQQMQREIENTYSSTVIREWLNPSNMGGMRDADAHARYTGPCGDTMELFLKIEGNTVTGASFLTDGCGATIACGSMLTKMISGEPVEQVRGVTDAHLLEKLGGLPEENEHCATLAVNTLHLALKEWKEKT